MFYSDTNDITYLNHEGMQNYANKMFFFSYISVAGTNFETHLLTIQK